MYTTISLSLSLYLPMYIYIYIYIYILGRAARRPLRHARARGLQGHERLPARSGHGRRGHAHRLIISY